MCFGFFLSPNRGVSRMIKEPLKWIWGSPNVRKPLNLIHRCRIYTYVINWTNGNVVFVSMYFQAKQSKVGRTGYKLSWRQGA